MKKQQKKRFFRSIFLDFSPTDPIGHKCSKRCITQVLVSKRRVDFQIFDLERFFEKLIFSIKSSKLMKNHQL